MKSKRLYITMSIFILLFVGGGTILGLFIREDIQIRWYISRLDSEENAERKKAFEWLKKLAEKNIKDNRLKAFFKHPESEEQLDGESLFSAIESAVESGELVDLKILLENGADVNKKIKVDWIPSGWTPLHYASFSGRDEIAKILIEHRADVNAKASSGLTPLHFAVKNGDEKVSQTLIEHRADVNSKTNKGRTPLHYAAWSGKDEIVKILIEKGADVNKKANDGWTPLDYARDADDNLTTKEKQAIITLLRQHGAKTGAELDRMQEKKK